MVFAPVFLPVLGGALSGLVGTVACRFHAGVLAGNVDLPVPI
jgi:hypothetical protein